jgi:hypothetical protein
LTAARDPASVRAWTAVLDGIERGVDACARRYLAGEDVDVPAGDPPPPDLGPLPRELEPRARAVLAHLRDTESKLARVPRPGAAPRRARFSATPHREATFERRA